MEWQAVKRTRVMIVDTDWSLGIKLADWLAAHGYQPVLHRSYAAAIDELNSIRPQAMIIAVDSYSPAEQAEVSQLLFRLQTVYPDMPVIGIADIATGRIAPFSGHCGVHRLIKPVDFLDVDRLLKSELCLATV